MQKGIGNQTGQVGGTEHKQFRELQWKHNLTESFVSSVKQISERAYIYQMKNISCEIEGSVENIRNFPPAKSII